MSRKSAHCRSGLITGIRNGALWKSTFQNLENQKVNVTSASSKKLCLDSSRYENNLNWTLKDMIDKSRQFLVEISKLL
ncbi:hypothetical protein NPIL_517061, partial [Nephila pilipes]